MAGLLKGTGKGLVGLLVRPTGGIIDLASGTLDLVTRYIYTENIIFVVCLFSRVSQAAQ